MTAVAWLAIVALGAAIGWADGTWLADDTAATVDASPAPTPEPGPTVNAQGDFTVDIDDTGDVVCYTNHDAGRMDCVPINQTRYAGT